MIQFTALIQAAADAAVRAHAETTRKSSSALYVSHPIAILQILACAGVSDPAILAAGLLHDVIEDTSWTAEQLRVRLRQGGVDCETAFRVVSMVQELSEVKLGADGKKRPWTDRKLEHLEHMGEDCTTGALLVKLADCLHNAQTVLLASESDPKAADVFAANRDQQRWYRLAVANLPIARKELRWALVLGSLSAQIRETQRLLDNHV